MNLFEEFLTISQRLCDIDSFDCGCGAGIVESKCIWVSITKGRIAYVVVFDVQFVHI